MSIDCRYASLLAFLESRDSQTRLSFDDRPSQDDGCGRQDGGRFGTGNNCASGGGGAYSTLPRSFRTTPDGAAAQYTDAQLKYGSPFESAKKAKSLIVESPRRVVALAKKAGIKDPSDIITIGAASSVGAEISVKWRSSVYSGSEKITIASATPMDPEKPELGAAAVQVSFGNDKDVHYDFFSPDSIAFEAIERGDISVNVVSASVLALMAKSLEAAERNGMKSASTNAAGRGTGSFASAPTGNLQGYRLWPKFGFDGDVDRSTSRQFADLPNAGRLLSDEARARFVSTGSLRVQDIVATKEGEEWWNRFGHPVDLELDFSDKSSPGYQRYQRMIAVGRKAAEKLARQGRSAIEFWEWESARVGQPSFTEFRAYMLASFYESRNCGTGTGGFQKGNTCASGAAADIVQGAAKGAIKGAAIAAGISGPVPPFVAKGAAVGAAVGAVKGLYDNQMQPTRIMNRIKKIGTTEEQVTALNNKLGGSKSSVASLKSGKLVLQVKDEGGKKLFDVELGEKAYTVTPSRESGTLRGDEMKAIKKIAEENSPKEIGVVVKSTSPSYMAKLVRAGFKVAANEAGVLVATAAAPLVPGLAGTAVAVVAESLKKKK